ncbi:MAG TPA: hypothetical protein VFI80_08720 [Burkholderiales bacterium]|nr:hypothetical protein [Burkholderiales bacterium]
MREPDFQKGVGQVILLVVVAIVLAVGYVAIDLYAGGQKEVTVVETRGVQMMSALSAFKRDQGAYPDALDKLVPKYVLAVARCPGGAPMSYLASAGEYVLSCSHVVFKYLPYTYDSRSKSWGG